MAKLYTDDVTGEVIGNYSNNQDLQTGLELIDRSSGASYFFTDFRSLAQFLNITKLNTTLNTVEIVPAPPNSVDIAAQPLADKPEMN